MKHLQFVQDFSDDHLRQLAEMAQLKEFPADEVVSARGNCHLGVPGRPGQRGPGIQGALPRHMQFQTVSAGDLLGWTAVLGPGPMTATALVQTPSTLLVLNTAQIRAWCAGDPSFGSAFMQHLARALATRLSATRLLLMDLYREDQLPARQDRIA